MQGIRPLLLKVIFLILTFIIMVSNFNLSVYTGQMPEAVKGKLDLDGYHFNQKGMLCLDGEWQFFYGRFIKPAAYPELQDSDKPDVYTTPPTVWNEYKINGKPTPGFGYGSYRMVVSGVTPGVPMAIKILPQSTAYRLYIDDRLLADNGRVSKDKGHSAVSYHPDSVSFTPSSGEFVITVYISNYVYARGGMWDAPTLGTQKQIADLDGFILRRDLFLEGCYITMLFMFLVIYLNRPQSRSWLYFALLCIITSARILIYGAHLINLLTGNFRLITFIEYATRLWFPILLVLLVNDELAGKIQGKYLTWLTLMIAAATAAVAALPIHIYTMFAKVVMYYNVGMGVMLCTLILWPGERFFPKNKNKIFYIYGIFAIFISACYDILFAPTAYVELTPIGFFVALLAFAFILAINYTDALAVSENALLELQAEGERKLHTELKLLQSQIRPHFIYNALSAISNVCVKDGKKAEQLILDLAYFMQASFDYSSNAKLIPLENELEYIRKYVNIEKARFEDRIKYIEQIDIPLSTQIPRLIIEPLVENAIRHGISRKKSGGEVRLLVAESPDGIYIEVSDDGVGISKEKLAVIFDGESRGVGLKNIQDRLIRFGGAGLTIECKPEHYTKVSFTIKKEG